MHYDIKVGLSCNNACKHCVVKPVVMAMQNADQIIDDSTEQIEQKINIAIARGYDSIVLTGGEVTIRPDFQHLVNYALSKNLYVTVQTNARRLSNPAMLAQLTQTNKKKLAFVVAIHASSREIHDDITRRKGSFEQTRQAIVNLAAEGFYVVIKIVVSKYNMKHLTDTIALAANLGINDVCIAFPHAEDFARNEFFEVVPMYCDLQDELNRTLSCRTLYPSLNLSLETFPFCQLPLDLWACNTDLDYIRKQNLQTPNLINMPGLEESMNWDVLRPEIKTKMSVCQLCLMEHVCEGAWHEYVDLYGPDEFTPISDMKPVETLLSQL